MEIQKKINKTKYLKIGDFVNCIYPVEFEIKGHNKYSEVCFTPWPKHRNLIFPLWTFHLYVATFQQYFHIEYAFLNWFDIPEPGAPIMFPR
jgi:hypothetical protein